MSMRHRSLCILLAIAIQSFCSADVTKLPADDRKVLLDASRFHEVHSTKDLPRAIVALCVDDKGKLADPGQNWNPTDAITDPTLPWKRLIWAAVGGDYYVVHYERGGIDHSFHILVAKLAKNDAKPTVVLACRWTPIQRLRSISRRIANRKVGRSFRLWALSHVNQSSANLSPAFDGRFNLL
jgi:hypothetical protein